eukprot:12900603-Ditylum_brightwellii.AAC.1
MLIIKCGNPNRINKILNGAINFRRIKVEAKDVMLPFTILLSLSMLVLICWTAIAPLKYTRTSNAGTDNFNRVMALLGLSFHCSLSTFRQSWGPTIRHTKPGTCKQTFPGQNMLPLR